jgi:hypothetical protein
MAQAGFTPIQLYFSTTAAAVPTSGNLANGELAINITDGKLYFKNNSGTVTLLAGSGGGGPAAGSNTQVQFNSSGSFGASSNLTWDGTTFSVVGRLYNGSASTFGASTWGISIGNGGVSANYFKASTSYFQNDAGTQILQLSAGALALTGAANAIYSGVGTTGWSGFAVDTTGGNAIFGLDDSTGSTFGSEAYATVIKSTSKPIYFKNGNTTIGYWNATGLGIGTTSVTQRLHVATTSGNAYIRVDRASQATGQVGLQIGGGTSSVDWIAYMPASSDDLVFFGNSSNRVRMTSAGDVVIGADSAASKLDVVRQGNSSGGTIMMSGSKTNNQNKYGNLTGAHYASSTYPQGICAIGVLSTTDDNFVDIGGNVGEQIAANKIRFWTAANTTTSGGTQRGIIDALGNFGIGTASPAFRLDVVRGSSGVVLNLQGVDAYSAETAISMATQRAKISAFLSPTGGFPGADLRFYTTPDSGSMAEQVRITREGAFCVGTTGTFSNAGIVLDVGSGGTNRPIAVHGTGGVDGVYVDWLVSAPYGSNTNEINIIKSSISSAAGNSGLQFFVSDGGGASTTTRSFQINRTSCTVVGSLSKGSGSFKIDHPLPEKTDTHHLVHSFIEGPQADLIYRGKVNLVEGKANVNIDTAAGMTEGTFVVLCRDVQCFTTNESDWTAVRGSVSGNTLTIEAQDQTCTANISWMVIGERQDKHMYDTDWTDDDGKVIVEPLKS